MGCKCVKLPHIIFDSSISSEPRVGVREVVLPQATGEMVELMVSMMRDRRASARLVELAAEVIAADARLNGRVGCVDTNARFGEKLVDTLYFFDNVKDECRHIKDEFERGLDVDTACRMLDYVKTKLEDFARRH